MSYHWPGNVRELENTLERAVLVCDGQVIHGHHLPPSLQTAEASGTVTRVVAERRRAGLREGPDPGRAEDDARQPRQGGAPARHDRAHHQLQGEEVRDRRAAVYGVELFRDSGLGTRATLERVSESSALIPSPESRAPRKMPVNDQLDAFVKRGLEQGLERARMQQALLEAGWPPDQVRKALAAYVDVDFPIPVPRPLPSATTRDAFMYIVVLGTMVLCAYQFGALLFAIIDRLVPDPMDQRVYAYWQNTMRWSISTLIVAFPVFVATSRLVERTVKLDPTKRASRIRRRLTYIVLFVASCVLIGDLTTLVYYFLGGEVTLRFFLKVLTVASIAGAVFLHYLWDLRAAEEEPETWTGR